MDGVGVDVDHADQDGGKLPNHLLLLLPHVTPAEIYCDNGLWAIAIEQLRIGSANSEFEATIFLPGKVVDPGQHPHHQETDQGDLQ